MKPNILVAGVLALDNLKTPQRSEEKIVGGAGVYSSISSNIFTNTALVAAIGNDFPENILRLIKEHGINTESVSKLDYPTFHWSGEYKGDMSRAITHKTELLLLHNLIFCHKPEVYMILYCLLEKNLPNLQIL